MGVGGPQSSDLRLIRWFILAVAFMLASVQLLNWVWLAFESQFTIFPSQPPPPASGWTGPFLGMFALNLVAVLGFALRPRGYGFWLLLVTQIADAITLLVVRVLSVFAGDFVSTTLLIAFATSLVSAILLLVARYARVFSRT